MLNFLATLTPWTSVLKEFTIWHWIAEEPKSGNCEHFYATVELTHPNKLIKLLKQLYTLLFHVLFSNPCYHQRWLSVCFKATLLWNWLSICGCFFWYLLDQEAKIPIVSNTPYFSSLPRNSDCTGITIKISFSSLEHCIDLIL